MKRKTVPLSAPPVRPSGQPPAHVSVHSKAAANLVQPKMALNSRPGSPAPQVYRPIAVPKVLQTRKPTVVQTKQAHPLRPATPRVAPVGRPTNSGTIQRMAVRAWEDFNLSTFTYQSKGFVEVLQSSNSKIHPYIGTGIAFTTGMHTCASLAIYDPTSKVSYLLHADATCDPTAIAKTLRQYAENVKNRKAVYARIFTLPGEENSYAVRAIKTAFTIAKADFNVPSVETRKKDGSYEIEWDSVVIVGHGKPYIFTKEKRRLDYALKRYALHKKSRQQVTLARNAIIRIIQGPTAKSQEHGRLDEEDAYLNAAVKAYEEGDEELLEVLSDWRGKDYRYRAKMLVEEKAQPKVKPPIGGFNS